MIVLDCNAHGRKRALGLALLWRNETVLSLECFSLYHISVSCSIEEGDEWSLTRVYGNLEERNRCLTWCMLELGIRGGDADHPRCWLI